MPLVQKAQPYAKRVAHPGIWSSHPCSRKSNAGRNPTASKVCHPFFKGIREDSLMANDAYDRGWEWVEKPADSPLIPGYLHDAGMQLLG